MSKKKTDIIIPEGDHAKLSASSAERWLACPGSVNASEGEPNTTTFFAAEGTLAHYVASECLEKGIEPKYFLGAQSEIEGHRVEVDQDMVEHVISYMDYIKSHETETSETHIEVDVTDEMINLHSDFGGMSDATIVDLGDDPDMDVPTLTVIDLKYGSGHEVDPTENKQLMYYGLGAYLKHFPHRDYAQVKLCIFQPRISDPKPKEWLTDTNRLFEEFKDEIVTGAELTEIKNAPLNAGEHCTFCRAKHKCKELVKAQHALMADHFNPIAAKEGAIELTPEKVGEGLELIPQLEARIKGLREFAYYLMSVQGIQIPNHKLVAKRATRKWKDQDEVINYLDLKGIDESEMYSEPKFRSPAQIEKLLPSKERKKFNEQFVDKFSTGTNLVHESAKGKALPLERDNKFKPLTDKGKDDDII